MAHPNTAQKSRQSKFGKAVRKALIDRDSSITKLAKELGSHRNSVRWAIDTELCPHLRARIATHLQIQP